MISIAQLTDLHICAPGTLAYGAVDTMSCLLAAVAHLNALAPDALVITGDLTDHGTVEEYAYLRPALDGLTMPWWPIPGNHDGPAFWEVFADRMAAPQRGIGHVAELSGLRIVLLDTTVPGADHGEISEARAEWLATVLTGRSLLAMHHPPHDTGIGFMDRIGLRHKERLAEVVRATPPLGVICGHVHRTITGAIAGVSARTAPSCAHSVALDLGAEAVGRIALEPPGVALHLLVDGALVTHISPIGRFDGPAGF